MPMNPQAQHKRKYLSTSEMVTGIRKKTNDPIPQVTIPGDFRVYRPTKHDVLCGRGKPIQDHIGNLRMRNIIANNAHRYFHARKHKKQQIVEEVVELVKCSGGVYARFLKRVGRENYWVEVPTSVACDKVSHGLRCFVRKSELSESPESQNEEEHSQDEEGGGGDDHSSSNVVRSSSPASSSALQDSMSAQDFPRNPADGLLSKLVAAKQMELARLALEPAFHSAAASLTPGAPSSIPIPSYSPSGTAAFLPPLPMPHGTHSHNLSNAQLVEFLARERVSREGCSEIRNHLPVVHPRDQRGEQDQIRIQELIKQAALKQGTNEILVSHILQQHRHEEDQTLTLAFVLAATMGGVR